MSGTRRRVPPTPRQGTARASALAGFTVDVVRSHTVAVVRVAGHLTGPGYRRVADTLGWLSEAGVRDVTVYVDVPGGIDAAGLQLLRAARGRFAAAGGALAVDSIRPGIRAALEWTGLAEEAAV